MAGKTTEGLLIGPMTEEDIDEVLAIELRSFTTPWSEILFFNETRKERSIPLVARLGDSVVGYLCANHVLDEGHILDLAVHPEFRRQGVASRLIGECLARLRGAGCRSVFLDVRDSNAAAKEMYAGFGFTQCGTRKGYYQEPVEDAAVLVLRICQTDER